MKRYINLCSHSNGTKGETVVTPEEIVEFAVKDGASAVALTDFNSVHGFLEFSEAAKKYKDKGFKPIFGVQLYGINLGNNSAPRKVTLLAKNQTGLKNIYRIISSGYTKELSSEIWPCVSYDDIQISREGVLVGLDCTRRDWYQAWTDGQQDHEGEKTSALVREEYAIADFIKIKPWRYYSGLMGHLADIREPEEFVIKFHLNSISVCCSLVGKFAVAANDSNCITKEDELCFDILHSEGGIGQVQSAKYMTTEELLGDYGLPEKFDLRPYGFYKNETYWESIREYYGPEMAQKIVLDNPNAIADMIEDVVIKDNIRHPFVMENADERLKAACEKGLEEKYGESIPGLICERYESEMKNIRANGFASYYILASMLAEKSRTLGYLHNLRGCAGGSFIAYLLGVSETNPLPPHYYCPKCKRIEFVDTEKYPSGFDLNQSGVEQRLCPNCSEQLVGDGHNIPVEFFAGYRGNKEPDFDFNFSSDIQKDMINYLGEIFGEDKTFYAGTKGTISHRRAECLVDRYCCEYETNLSPVERNKLKNRLSSVCRIDGRHPGGIVIVPAQNEVFDFTPVGYNEQFQLRENIKRSTLIEYHELELEKYDILGHTMLTKLKLMEDYTGISAKSIRFNEIDIFSFFMNDSFKGLPFDGDFIRRVTDKVFPARFSDLVKISGFSHGTNVWTDNGENLAGTVCDPSELIAHRDDVMLKLIRHGIDRETAYEIAEMVRKGKAGRCLTEAQEAMLLEHGIPKWYIDSMKKIMYLFPKAHATEYVTNYLRMIWYKIYYPAEFYAAVLSVDATDFDYSILAEGQTRVELELSRFNQEWGDDYVFDEWNGEGWAKEQKRVLELALECYERGIGFLPADINISDPRRFVPEKDAIRIAFNCPERIDEASENVIL